VNKPAGSNRSLFLMDFDLDGNTDIVRGEGHPDMLTGKVDHRLVRVLLHTNLTRVLDAIDLSRRTHNVVVQNLFWAFCGGGAMVISSLPVVGDSYRLSKG
jgi:hypothetical protein